MKATAIEMLNILKHFLLCFYIVISFFLENMHELLSGRDKPLMVQSSRAIPFGRCGGGRKGKERSEIMLISHADAGHATGIRDGL